MIIRSEKNYYYYSSADHNKSKLNEQCNHKLRNVALNSFIEFISGNLSF